eukprot:Tamp_01913.p1 GENE.Tamp_01913~~Tamp_01913.p1  ORF type:complete len:955 (+),score=284.97 Tamp_01913:1710-4574(+)
MGSDTPPPPVIAGAAGGAPRAEPQAAGAAPSAKAASPQEASGKPADTGGYGLSILPVNGKTVICTESPITVMWVAPASHSVVDFLALYKEGSSESYFSLKELKGTDGKPSGEITFDKPPDERSGDPRLPALAGNYIVKYQDGQTKEVKQEKKFAVEKCDSPELKGAEKSENAGTEAAAAAAAKDVGATSKGAVDKSDTVQQGNKPDANKQAVETSQKPAATKDTLLSAVNQVEAGKAAATDPASQASANSPYKEGGRVDASSAVSKVGGTNPEGAGNAESGTKSAVKAEDAQKASASNAAEKKQEEGVKPDTGSAGSNEAVTKPEGADKAGEKQLEKTAGAAQTDLKALETVTKQDAPGKQQLGTDDKEAPKAEKEGEQKKAGAVKAEDAQKASASNAAEKKQEEGVKPDAGSAGSNEAVTKPEGADKAGEKQVEKTLEAAQQKDGQTLEKPPQAEKKEGQSSDAGSKEQKKEVIGTASEEKKEGKVGAASEEKKEGKESKAVESAPTASSPLDQARAALTKDWGKLEEAGAGKASEPKPISNPDSPEAKGPPGRGGAVGNGPSGGDDDDDDDERDNWGGGEVGKGGGGGSIGAMTPEQEVWLNGPRSKGALAGRDKDKEGSAPSAPPSQEKVSKAEVQQPEVRPQAIEGGKSSGAEGGSRQGAEGGSRQETATKTKASQTALKAADAAGDDARSDKAASSKGKKAEADGKGMGAGKAAGGFAGLLAMAGISPAPSPLLMGAAGGGLCLLVLGAFVVRQKLKGSKSRGGDASGSYFSIEMSEADLEAGVVTDEFNLLATESSDVCTVGAGGRRDSNEGDGWGGDDGWDEDFEDQTSYPTLTALDKNGMKVLFDFEKSDPDSFTTIIMATIRNSAKDDLTNFSCKVAVPKHLQITIGPPSSTILRGSGGAITQTMNVTNAHRGVKPLKMRMVLGYDRNGKKERQEADIINFPKEL